MSKTTLKVPKSTKQNKKPLLPLPPITKFECDGSKDDILICYYSSDVPQGLRIKLVNWLKKECKEEIYSTRWQTSKRLRIKLKGSCMENSVSYTVQSSIQSKSRGPKAKLPTK